MLALAIILLAIVAVLIVASFTGTSEEVVIEFANVTITSSVGGVFVAGVAAGLVALASIVALKMSISRRRRHNREVRELRRRAELAASTTTTTVPDVEPEPAASDPLTGDPAASGPDGRDPAALAPDGRHREVGGPEVTDSDVSDSDPRAESGDGHTPDTPRT